MSAQSTETNSGQRSSQNQNVKPPVTDTNPFNKSREPWFVEKRTEPGVYFVDANNLGKQFDDGQGTVHTIGILKNPDGTTTNLKDKIKWDQPDPAQNAKTFWQFGYTYNLWDKAAEGTQPRKLLIYRRPEPIDPATQKKGSGGGGSYNKGEQWRTVDVVPVETKLGQSIEAEFQQKGLWFPSTPVAYGVYDPNAGVVRHFVLGIRRKKVGGG